MKLEYPDDRFELCMTRSSEQVWRLRCLDCPGKVYTPGAGMSNFEVHLKNRNHRRRVAERLKFAESRIEITVLGGPSPSV
ncbi:hypothetical protein BGY98DRAFT_929209 [Russula aff. rugulosa BPL654]|nr:hypothetical protein BGY98DRAFT_929209 [Russula aff. rugulosa BPL654]